MNENLGTLIAGDLTGLIDGGSLRIVDHRRAPGAGALDCPAIDVGYNMLISLGHFWFTARSEPQEEPCTREGSWGRAALTKRTKKIPVRIRRLRSHTWCDNKEDRAGEVWRAQ